MKVAIIFGGRSSEHDVSCISAATIAEAVDKERHEVVLLGITKEGHWLKADSISSIKDGSWRDSAVQAFISPDTRGEIVYLERGRSDIYEDEERLSYAEAAAEKIDVAFPVLHGLYGEDGTIQGLLEMSGIPYVGCGHVASGITMDKFFTKVIAEKAGVDQASFVPVRRHELVDPDKVADRVEESESYPVFIKPSNAGSSVGITKAHNRSELIEGLHKAAAEDSKILVEEFIDGREIECAVFGHDDDVIAAGVGEIIAAAEFYDFDAKYNSDESKTIINPELPEGKLEEIKDAAVRIYRACDCFGMSRVDFFLERGTGRVVFNEINAIPGHTSISMYPMIMDAAGMPLCDYVEKLIEMAFERKK